MLELNFDRHQNIIWGLNGSGKTTLLKVLNSALIGEVSPLVNSPVTFAEVEIQTEEHGRVTRRYSVDSDSARQLQREIEAQAHELLIDESGIDPDISNFARYRAAERWLRLEAHEGWETTYASTSKRTRPGAPLRMGHQYLSINRLVREPRGASSSRAEDYESSLDEAFSSRVTERWIRYQSSSLSEIRVIQQQGLGRVLSVLFGGPEGNHAHKDIPPTEPGHAYMLTRDFLRSQNIRVNFSRQSFIARYLRERQYSEVVEHIKEVTESVDNALLPQRELERLVAELYSGGKELTLGRRGIEVRVGKKEIPLKALSSGERQLLFILLHTMAGGSNAVIIDEPEISLHVDWQERLVRSMRTVNPDCQLILATHSPDVMANVDSKFIRRI